MLSSRFARAAALASALLIGLSSAAAYARPPAPPPGRPGGPGFHRPAPPPPPPRYYRNHHRHWHNWGWLAPLTLGGLIVGAELYSRPERVEVPVPYPVPVPAQPAVPAAPVAQYPWYWCSTARGYYPGVATCPVPWTTIMGTSPTNPPAPPM